MPLALILSSHVAGSRVGGFPQALVLAGWGIDPVLVPTVMFGRRPGRDTPPGGAAVEDAAFEGMLEGVAAHGLFGLVDTVITGYFASARQVEAAAATIDGIRAAKRVGAFGPRVTVVVDPIMGDEPDGLYVREEVAAAVERELLPRANLLTPNLWELKRISDADVGSPGAIVEATRALGRPVLTTSVTMGRERIGAVYVDDAHAVAFSHAMRPAPPNGTGDVVAAVLAAGMVEGLTGVEAAQGAIRAAAETVFAAAEWRAPELPIVALGPRLRRPTAEVTVELLDGTPARGA